MGEVTSRIAGKEADEAVAEEVVIALPRPELQEAHLVIAIAWQPLHHL